MTSTLQVQFAIDDLPRGEAIVTHLLEQRLVACAQTVGPITSRYWWDGSINRAEEWLFLCKTTAERLDDVIDAVSSRHPYEVPEIVACEVVDGLRPYLDWIAAETQTPPRAARS
jgi:periplasmic divalent cation tolerance protein